MTSTRVLKPIAIVACAALIGFVAYAIVAATHRSTGAFPPVAAPSQLHAGSSAPSFSIPPLSGTAKVIYAGHSAEPVVLNFFASWCANCVAELEAFATVSNQSRATRFIGVDSEDPARASALSLLRHAGIQYKIGSDPSGSVASRYLISALPVTYFISANGSVRGELFGAATAAELRSWVKRLGGTTN